MNDMILNIIIASAPALSAVLGVVIVALKVIREIKDLKSDQLKELKNKVKEKEAELKLQVQENYELKKEINGISRQIKELHEEIKLLKRKR